MSLQSPVKYLQELFPLAVSFQLFSEVFQQLVPVILAGLVIKIHRPFNLAERFTLHIELAHHLALRV